MKDNEETRSQTTERVGSEYYQKKLSLGIMVKYTTSLKICDGLGKGHNVVQTNVNVDPTGHPPSFPYNNLLDEGWVVSVNRP